MTPAPTFVHPETSIEDVATMMANEKLYTLPVVEDDKLVGVVGKEDVLKTLLKS
jgi:CBS domain-containing protein